MGWRIPAQILNVASAKQQQLTSTSQTTIATFTPITLSFFVCFISLTITNAATAVTVKVTYQNPVTASLETVTLLNSQTLDVEDHLQIPCNVLATAGAPISILVTAGTANNVYATASIFQIV